MVVKESQLFRAELTCKNCSSGDLKFERIMTESDGLFSILLKARKLTCNKCGNQEIFKSSILR